MLPAEPTSSSRSYRIQLVGAGPGSPDLLTVGAYKALTSADLVIADRLVDQAILDLVRGELKIARKEYGSANKAQDELNGWVLQGAKEGKHVVRLKNGDPLVFGRGGEEIIEYAKHGFVAEVIPGISSCIAGPASAGIPCTLRGVADQLLICTGHGMNDTEKKVPDFEENRTTVFLMAMGRLRNLCERLVEVGYPSDLPAAIIERATCPGERCVRGTISCIAEKALQFNVKPPGVLVVGHVVTSLQGLNQVRTVVDRNDDEGEWLSNTTFKQQELGNLARRLKGLNGELGQMCQNQEVIKRSPNAIGIMWKYPRSSTAIGRWVLRVSLLFLLSFTMLVLAVSGTISWQK